jgi:hypothetical protein
MDALKNPQLRGKHLGISTQRYRQRQINRPVGNFSRLRLRQEHTSSTAATAARSSNRPLIGPRDAESRTGRSSHRSKYRENLAKHKEGQEARDEKDSSAYQRCLCRGHNRLLSDIVTCYS